MVRKREESGEMRGRVKIGRSWRRVSRKSDALGCTRLYRPSLSLSRLFLVKRRKKGTLKLDGVEEWSPATVTNVHTWPAWMCQVLPLYPS